MLTLYASNSNGRKPAHCQAKKWPKRNIPNNVMTSGTNADSVKTHVVCPTGILNDPRCCSSSCSSSSVILHL